MRGRGAGKAEGEAEGQREAEGGEVEEDGM
jgi:hypothetical protein